MPFIVGLTKQAVHKCAKCLNDVKQSSLFGLNSLEDKVITAKLGNFGIILTRRYLLYIIFVIAAILSIYTFILIENDLDHHHISSKTWDDYRQDCGYQVFVKDPRKAFRNFEMKYYGEKVSWEGYVIRVDVKSQ